MAPGSAPVGSTLPVTVALYDWSSGGAVVARDPATGVPLQGSSTGAAAVVAPAPPAAGARLAAVGTCTTTVTVQAALSEKASSGPGVGTCTLTLPAMGVFALVATATLPSSSAAHWAGEPVTTSLPVGRSLEQWVAAPLTSLSPLLQVVTDKSAYLVGDVAQLRFANPLAHASVMTVVGSPVRGAPVTAPVVTFTSLPAAPGPVTLSVPITERACGANCVVTVVITSNTAQVWGVVICACVFVCVCACACVCARLECVSMCACVLCVFA